MAKQKGVKGKKKERPDNDDPELNPLLHVENKKDFIITTSNLLEDPEGLIYEGFEPFDLKEKEIPFDYSRFDENSLLVIMLRYYEYLCTAQIKVDYILPLLSSGMTGKQVFDIVCHCLKNKLLCNVPSFDTIFEPDIQYIGKIKYNTEDEKD
jgi:hypothetical protein